MASTKISSKSVSYEQYIEETLLPGVREMQSMGLAFLSFGLIGISIEVLGSFFDSYPLNEEGHSRERFIAAVDKLFTPLGKDYGDCSKCMSKDHDDYCLYRGLRCGMAHIGRPEGKIAFTTRAEASADKNTHLGKDAQATLILVAEDLLHDFEAAWSLLKTLSATGQTQKQVTDHYLTITSK